MKLQFVKRFPCGLCVNMRDVNKKTIGCKLFKEFEKSRKYKDVETWCECFEPANKKVEKQLIAKNDKIAKDINTFIDNLASARRCNIKFENKKASKKKVAKKTVAKKSSKKKSKK